MFGFRSDFQRHAGDVVVLELLARRMRLVAIEAGETGAVVGLGAFDRTLDVGFGLVKDACDLALGGVEALFRLALVFIRADLNRPATPDCLSN